MWKLSPGFIFNVTLPMSGSLIGFQAQQTRLVWDICFLIRTTSQFLKLLGFTVFTWKIEFPLNRRAIITSYSESVFIPQVVLILHDAIVIRMGLNMFFLQPHFDLHSQIGGNRRPRPAIVVHSGPGSAILTRRYSCCIICQTSVGNIVPLQVRQSENDVIISSSSQFRRHIFAYWLKLASLGITIRQLLLQ